MRGFASSFLTPASVESWSSFLRFLLNMPKHDIERDAVQSHFAQLRLAPGNSAKPPLSDKGAYPGLIPDC